MSQIVIVSGGSGAGKSSACESLCERYDRTVHLETDDVFGWIRMGFVQPWKAGSMEQNRMISRAVARAATAFAQQRFGVFIDGVIGPHLLPDYIEELKPAGVPVHYAVLLPPAKIAVQRARQRGNIGDSSSTLTIYRGMEEVVRLTDYITMKTYWYPS